VMSS